MNNVITTNRFKAKQQMVENTRSQQDNLKALDEAAKLWPESLLWPLAYQIAEVLVDTKYQEYHGDYTQTCGKDEDSAWIAFKSVMEGEPVSFLVLQTTEAIPNMLVPVAGDEHVNELACMMYDINSNDTSVCTPMVAKAMEILTSADYLIIGLEGDPDTQVYQIVALTKDRVHVLNLDIRYDIVQRDIEIRKERNKK